MDADGRRVLLNLALSIPIGAVGGAIAGELMFIGFSIGANIAYASVFPNDYEVVGSVIGVATFPIACMTLVRTANIWTSAAAGLIATIVAGLAMYAPFSLMDSHSAEPGAHDELLWIILLIALFVVPVSAMFVACGWVARREKRRAKPSPAA